MMFCMRQEGLIRIAIGILLLSVDRHQVVVIV